MTDTETRLRDYLHAKADTVPDDAPTPGLELDPPKRRSWLPVTLAAAAIGAVLVLTVPFLTNLADKTPSPAGRPTGPVSAESPKIPYMVKGPARKGDPYPTVRIDVHDGGKTVAAPSHVLSRIAGGWTMLGAATAAPDSSRIAILTSSGRVRELGPERASFGSASPDRRQIAAMVNNLNRRSSRVVVLDVETGKEVASLAIKGLIGVQGWDKNGIWLYQVDQAERKGIVWQPGWKTPRTVPGVIGRQLATNPNTEMVVDTNNVNPDRYCLRAGIPSEQGLQVKREHCAPYATRSEDPDNGRAAPTAHISPDGATMVADGTAVDIATGEATKLQLPKTNWTWAPAVFEDATNVILVTDVAEEGPKRMFRCSVTTGECKDLQIALKPDESFMLATP